MIENPAIYRTASRGAVYGWFAGLANELALLTCYLLSVDF